MKKGKLIVIESGVDGSGKATQTKKLYKALIERGYAVRKVSFPSYDKPYSILVKMYLNGEFGSNPEDVDCYTCSTFFAADRYASYQTDWGKFYEEGGIILCDRYTTSNMVHQAAKLEREEREKFLDWLWDFEFRLYKLPIPDQVLFLDVAPDVGIKLRENRLNKITGEEKQDIHESNKIYLEKSYQTAQYIAKKYQWEHIDCMDNGTLKDINTIHKLVLKKVLNLVDGD